MQIQQIFVAVLEVSSSCGTISLFPLGEIMLVYNNSSTLNKYYIYTLNEDFAKLVTTLYPVQSPKSQPIRTWYHTSSIPSSVYWTDTRYSTTPTQLPFQILLGNFPGFKKSTTGLIETNIDAVLEMFVLKDSFELPSETDCYMPYPQPNTSRWGTASIVVTTAVSKSTWGVQY